jgi:hypothetical protein
MLINFRRKKELSWVVPHKALVTELHHGESIVEGFERRFLSFASKHMPKDHNRLAFTLDTEVLQRSLRGSDASELTGRAGTNPRHT